MARGAAVTAHRITPRLRRTRNWPAEQTRAFGAKRSLSFTGETPCFPLFLFDFVIDIQQQLQQAGFIQIVLDEAVFVSRDRAGDIPDV